MLEYKLYRPIAINIPPPLRRKLAIFKLNQGKLALGEINFSEENSLIPPTPTPKKFSLRRAKDFSIRGKLTFSEKMLGKLTFWGKLALSSN